jgi:hypothetical protein
MFIPILMISLLAVPILLIGALILWSSETKAASSVSYP